MLVRAMVLRVVLTRLVVGRAALVGVMNLGGRFGDTGRSVELAEHNDRLTVPDRGLRHPEPGTRAEDDPAGLTWDVPDLYVVDDETRVIRRLLTVGPGPRGEGLLNRDLLVHLQVLRNCPR